MKGFFARNIWRLRALYLAYTQQVQELPQAVAELDGQNLPQAVAEILWGHNVLLLEKVKDVQARLWYIHSKVFQPSNGTSLQLCYLYAF